MRTTQIVKKTISFNEIMNGEKFTFDGCAIVCRKVQNATTSLHKNGYIWKIGNIWKYTDHDASKNSLCKVTREEHIIYEEGRFYIVENEYQVRFIFTYQDKNWWTINTYGECQKRIDNPEKFKVISKLVEQPFEV